MSALIRRAFMAAAGAVDGAPVCDAYTKLLIHSDTDNGDTVFTDASPSAHVITPYGYVEHTTAQQKFGASSIRFDGNTSSRLAIADSTDWTFGTNDFTIDFWVRFDDLSTVRTMVYWGNSGNLAAFQLHTTFGLRYAGMVFDIQQGGGMTGWSVETWYHIAVTRSGNTWRLFKNGAIVKEATEVDDHGDFNELTIGKSLTSGQYMVGYMDEIRISKGIARWSADFSGSLPSAPYYCP